MADKSPKNKPAALELSVNTLRSHNKEVNKQSKLKKELAVSKWIASQKTDDSENIKSSKGRSAPVDGTVVHNTEKTPQSSSKSQAIASGKQRHSQDHKQPGGSSTCKPVPLRYTQARVDSGSLSKKKKKQAVRKAGTQRSVDTSLRKRAVSIGGAEMAISTLLKGGVNTTQSERIYTTNLDKLNEEGDDDHSDVDQQDHSVDHQGDLSIDEGNYDIDQEGHDIDQGGHDIDQEGHDIDQEGHDIDQEGHDIDQEGNTANDNHVVIVDQDNLSIDDNSHVSEPLKDEAQETQKIQKLITVKLMARQWKKKAAEKNSNYPNEAEYQTASDNTTKLMELDEEEIKNRLEKAVPKELVHDVLQEALMLMTKSHSMYRSYLGQNHPLTMKAMDHIQYLQDEVINDQLQTTSKSQN